VPLVRLAGCRSDSLLGYLKALGVLRLIAAQADAKARGSWARGVFVLETDLTENGIGSFFLNTYVPTPILNPWNSGAGFDGRADTAGNTLRRISETKGQRFEPYRQALAFVNESYVSTAVREQFFAANDKHGFIRDLRIHCPEQMLPWLDAALLLTSERLAFPYLFGSGGNDGRLDFSVNFAARVLDVCGDAPLSHAAALLQDSLTDTAQAPLLQDVAIGQFSPRHAGGPNATSGFSADSLVNPWDYVLMIEGALLFSGSVGKRTDRTPGRPVFPFALRGVPGGYGSASDEEQVRGEIWLPIWDGSASLASITDLLRKGRIDLPSDGERSLVRSAALASEAATAVLTLGLPLGIRELERVAFVQRNGLAFSAASIGAIRVDERYDQGIAIISHDLASWIDRIRKVGLGIGARDALRSFDERLFRFSGVPYERRPVARQELLAAVADLDRAVGRTKSETPAAPRLSAGIVDSLDDGSSVHRTAIAIASLGAAARSTDTREELRFATDDPVRTLRDLLERRTRVDLEDRRAGYFRATCSLSAEDAAAFLAFDRFERTRFSRLLRAYSLIDLKTASLNQHVPDEESVLPTAYAVLKLVFDHPQARDERIVKLLFTGNPTAGLRLAMHRVRTIRDLPSRARDVSDVQLEDAQWTAAALALPIERSVSNYRKLLSAALTTRVKSGEAGRVHTYLTSIV
jgi:CRISPR-associated protein Csx17